MREPMSFGKLLLLGVAVTAVLLAYAAIEYRGCGGECSAGKRLILTEYAGCICSEVPR